MLAWLMLRPKMLAGIGVLAVVASMWAAWKWEVRGLNKTISAREETIRDKDAELAVAKQTEALLRGEIQGQNVNLLACKSDIEAQSAKVHEFALKANLSQAKADAAALEILRAGELAAEKLRTDANRPSGHAALNAELCRRFGCAP